MTGTGDPTATLPAHYVDAPERARARARSMAGLTATAAGAVAVGLTFSGDGGTPDGAAAIFGFLGLCGLGLSLVLFGWASLHSSRGPAGENERATSVRLVGEIRRITFGAGGIAVIALVLLAAMVGLSRFGEDSSTWVEVRLESSALAQQRELCPNLSSSLEGLVDDPDLETQTALLKLDIAGRECDMTAKPGERVSIWIPRDTVLMVTLGTRQ